MFDYNVFPKPHILRAFWYGQNGIFQTDETQQNIPFSSNKKENTLWSQIITTHTALSCNPYITECNLILIQSGSTARNIPPAWFSSRCVYLFCRRIKPLRWRHFEQHEDWLCGHIDTPQIILCFHMWTWDLMRRFVPVWHIHHLNRKKISFKMTDGTKIK